MCAQYELMATAQELIAHFQQLSLAQSDMPQATLQRPTDSVLMITHNSDGYFGMPVRWGLLSDDLQIEDSKPRYNVRSEGLISRPLYGKILKGNRCLIPATAFYEWKGMPGGGKQKYRIAATNGKPLMFAGIFAFSRFHGNTCAILTTAAEKPISAVHDRMPVILEQGDWEAWLKYRTDFSDGELQRLMLPKASPNLVVTPVAKATPQLALGLA